MSSNREIMKDAITSAGTLQIEGAGGLLSPEQSKKFISYMVDNSAIMKDIRVETMHAPEKQLDLMLVGSRLLRKPTEATALSDLTGITTRRKELRSVKVGLTADISTDFLEDNIEGTDAKERIAKELAMQFGNDLTDLFINGDTDAVGDDASFLTIGDGIVKQAKTSTATHKYDLTGQSDYQGVIFPGMLSLMPNQFKRDRASMRFYCSSNVSDAYIRSVATRVTELGDTTLTTGNAIKYLGIQLFPVEYLPDDVIILTNKNNLVAGIQRAMKVYSQFNQKKDETEYTMYMRVDPGKILWDDALVIAYKITSSSSEIDEVDNNDSGSVTPSTPTVTTPAVAASVTLKDRETTPVDCLTVTAKSAGADGNDLSITIAAPTTTSDELFNVVVKNDGSTVETLEDCSMDTSASTAYIENVSSTYVSFEDISTSGTNETKRPALGTYSLSGGADAVTA